MKSICELYLSALIQVSALCDSLIQVSASSDSFLLTERPDIVLLNWPKFASWCSFLLLFFGTLLDDILVCKFSISDFRGQAQKKLKFLIGSRLLGRATPILLPDPPDQSSGPLLKLKKKPKTTECSTPRNKTDDPLPEFVSTLVDRDHADPEFG